jgi:molybdenum cofactor synthesis domain-containing protein
MKVAVLTISDRSAAGERDDRSGPIISDKVKDQGWTVSKEQVLSDDQADIESWLIDTSDAGDIDLILTTGGTGLAPRDLAPEATLAVIEKHVPGMVEAMRFASLQKTPHAMLSRAVAGIRGATLIVNLPGAPRAAEENLAVILPVLEHAVALLREAPDAEAGHRITPKPRHA